MVDAVAALAAECGLTWCAALEHSWEQLEALAEAHKKRNAVQTLQAMVAAQGDNKSWTAQHKALVETLKS